MPSAKRWRAIVTFDDGTFEVFTFEEFTELGVFLEAGRDWNEINVIQIIYLRGLKRPSQT